MYIPKSFEPPDVNTMQQFMGEHPFGVLVTVTSQGLDANHLPFVFDPAHSPYGTLRGHVGRANPIWRECQARPDALVMFQGPDSFISPSWYPTKQESGAVVPTWNYLVVHAHGSVRIVEDAAWLRAHVEALTDHLEAGRQPRWAVSDAPGDYIQKLVGAIVGIEMPIANLIGKWKLSQNRSERDRAGVVDGLRREGSASSGIMADLVQRTMLRER